MVIAGIQDVIDKKINCLIKLVEITGFFYLLIAGLYKIIDWKKPCYCKMNKYLKITLHPATEEQGEIWMALLADIGFYAFETDESLLYAFIHFENYDENGLRNIIGKASTFEIETIVERNWNAQWESDFQPVMVDSFVGIRATFHQPLKNVQHEIIITPKMSFGTGHHATTELMIRLMETISFKSLSVIDFGTGTGVLAILSEQLGASSITAIDNDDWSIHNAEENINMNHSANIHLLKGASPKDVQPADIFLANINLNVLMENADTIAGKIKPGGQLLMSGFLIENLNELKAKFCHLNFTFQNHLEKNNWVAASFIKLKSN